MNTILVIGLSVAAGVALAHILDEHCLRSEVDGFKSDVLESIYELETKVDSLKGKAVKFEEFYWSSLTDDIKNDLKDLKQKFLSAEDAYTSKLHDAYFKLLKDFKL